MQTVQGKTVDQAIEVARLTDEPAFAQIDFYLDLVRTKVITITDNHITL